jgi:predicted TIM-barrel fold metal-dependent hydrolase
MKRTSRTATRRQFLSTAATAVTLPVSHLTGASSQSGGTASGRIDCQSHLFVPELLDFMEKRKTTPYVYRKGSDRFVVVGGWHRRILPKHTDVAAKLSDMDANGIQMTALSINDPGPEVFGKDGLAIARMVHDYLGSLAKQYPTRFFGLATLPLQDMDGALVELDRCVKSLGMRGVLLYSNLDGKFPDLEEFRPLFARAQELDIPLLLHPAYPMTYDATKGYEMVAGLGLMFDTTIALSRIILAGILDQFPKLKLVCPHVGGALPYLIGRIDHQTQVLKRGAEKIRKPPSEYLKQVYLDTVTPIALGIRYAYDFAGPERLLFASDHPWVDPKLIAGNIESLKFPATDEKKIFAGNARGLFKLV